MKRTVGITERYNPGHYEFIEIRGQVEFEDGDLAADDDPESYALRCLDQLLEPHRRRAVELLPAESPSYLPYHPALES